MSYTPLPYQFDLLYDLKSVEQLHDHLTGRRRQATSATDQELYDLCIEFDIPLPSGAIIKLAGIPREKTLRDEFAMAAMQGFCAADSFNTLSAIAQDAYTLADAMLQERTKK